MNEPKKVWGLYALANTWICNITMFGIVVSALCFVLGVSGDMQYAIAKTGLVIGLLVAIVPASVYTIIVTPVDNQ